MIETLSSPRSPRPLRKRFQLWTKRENTPGMMETKIVEATNGPFNWGKFLVARYDEWNRQSVVSESGSGIPLFREVGQGHDTMWVLDLQTCEGAGSPRRVRGC